MLCVCAHVGFTGSGDPGIWRILGVQWGLVLLEEWELERRMWEHFLISACIISGKFLHFQGGIILKVQLKKKKKLLSKTKKLQVTYKAPDIDYCFLGVPEKWNINQLIVWFCSSSCKQPSKCEIWDLIFSVFLVLQYVFLHPPAGW